MIAAYILIGMVVGMIFTYIVLQFCNDGSLVIDISDPEEPNAVKFEGIDLDELVDSRRKKFILKIVRIKQ